MIDFAILQEATSLVVVFGLVTMVCAFLIVYAKVQMWLRAVLIPLVLALTFIGYITLIDILGKPFPGLPPDDSRLVHYQVDIRTNEHNIPKKYIIIWVYVESDHRLYRVPYSRALEEELIKADEDNKLGKPRKLIGTTGLEGDDSPLKFYEIPWKEDMPKDPPEGQ